MKIYQVMDMGDSFGLEDQLFFGSLDKAKAYLLQNIVEEDAVFTEGTWEAEGDGPKCWQVDGCSVVIFEMICN